MEKPSPVLSHMPWNVKQLIVDSVDTLTKRVLRSSCKEFNTLAETTGDVYRSVWVIIDYQRKSVRISLSIGETGLKETKIAEYRDHEDGMIFIGNGTEKIVENRNYIEAAVTKFSELFQNPKNHLKELILSFEFRSYSLSYHPTPLTDSERSTARSSFESMKTSVLDKIQTFLSSLSYLISVEQFHFQFNGNQDDILKVLPYFEPGTLEKITIEGLKLESTDAYSDIALDRVAATEQWKRAKECRMDELCASLPYEQWTHFTEANFRVREFKGNDARSLFQAFDNSEHCKRTSIQIENLDHGEVLRYLTEIGHYRVAKEMFMIRMLPPKSKCPVSVTLDFDRASGGRIYFSKIQKKKKILLREDPSEVLVIFDSQNCNTQQ